MASVRSLLGGGRTARRPDPEEALQEVSAGLDEAMKAALAALQGQVTALSQAWAKTDADLTASRAETAAERARLEAMRAQLMEAHNTMAVVQADRAGERALIEGLREQLAGALEGRAAMQQALDQAVVAAATREPINFPPHEPVAYEVVMVNPENGQRKNVSIKPVKS